MARSWKEMVKSNVCSVKVWFDKHKGTTKVVILEVDSKPPSKDSEPVLAIRIDVDDTWLRVNKTNALILDKAFGEDVDKWIGKKVNIIPDEVLYKGTLVPSMKINPVSK